MDISGVSAIQSLDVLYPASSALLAFNPALLKMQLAPIFEALRRGDWREVHAMADLGAYPAASGQISPAASRAQASAELALLAKMAGGPEGRAELQALAAPLAESDPTIRSAIALGPAAAPRMKRALEAPRDVIRADVFVDRLLGSGMVSSDAVTQELEELRSRLGKYGTPFESRKRIVHVDALLWMAALAEPAQREEIVASALRFYTATPTRVPAPDQYESETARPAGTQARPVIGAVFAPLLLHEARTVVK
jgi:hypothetical protein